MAQIDMNITFPGGKKVTADFMGRKIPTDQSKKAGGDETAPEPFMLFLASIGTCAGIYVLGFCQSRNLPTESLGLTERLEFDDRSGKLLKIGLDIKLPPDFPEKYVDAVVRAADQCTVKKTIINPPEFEIRPIVG